jgi:arylsulfatase
VLTYRTFEIAELVLTGKPLAPGRHQVEVVLRYDGGGRGRGAAISLVVDGKTAEHGRVAATPPAVFSIDETFDIGLNTGSPVGDYPVINPFRGGTVARVDIELDG